MNNIVLITGTCAGVVVLLLAGTYLKYRKVNVPGILSKLKAFLEGAEEYTKALEELATGKTQKALSRVELYEKLGQTAIGYAGQLLLSSQIEDDANGTKRKDAALSYIYAFLEKEGINIDDNVKTIASGIVESGILSNKTIQQINEQLDKLIQQKVVDLQEEKNKIQSQLQQVQAQVIQLTTENTNLKNAITTAANTAQTVTQPEQTTIIQTV